MEEKIIERILGHLSQSEVQIRKSLINFATKMISKKKIYPEDLDVEMVWLKEIFDDELTNALKDQRERILGEIEKLPYQVAMEYYDEVIGEAPTYWIERDQAIKIIKERR